LKGVKDPQASDEDMNVKRKQGSVENREGDKKGDRKMKLDRKSLGVEPEGAKKKDHRRTDNREDGMWRGKWE